MFYIINKKTIYFEYLNIRFYGFYKDFFKLRKITIAAWNFILIYGYYKNFFYFYIKPKRNLDFLAFI